MANQQMKAATNSKKASRPKRKLGKCGWMCKRHRFISKMGLKLSTNMAEVNRDVGTRPRINFRRLNAKGQSKLLKLRPNLSRQKSGQLLLCLESQRQNGKIKRRNMKKPKGNANANQCQKPGISGTSSACSLETMDPGNGLA